MVDGHTKKDAQKDIGDGVGKLDSFILTVLSKIVDYKTFLSFV